MKIRYVHTNIIARDWLDRCPYYGLISGPARI